jgi:hypothetical protein
VTRFRHSTTPRPFQIIGLRRGRRLTGAAVFRCHRASAIIAEVQTSEVGAARALLKGACRLAGARGAWRASLLIQAGTPLEQAALAAGFVPRPQGFPVVAADLAGGLPRAALFQGGDFDVI